MNTEQIFKLAISETHEPGQIYGLSLTASKHVAGCCTIGARNEDEFVLNIVNFAKNFSDSLQNQITEIREHYFCEVEIEDSDINEDDLKELIQNKNDIRILNSMTEWNCDMEKLNIISHHDWRNLEKNRA